MCIRDRDGDAPIQRDTQVPASRVDVSTDKAPSEPFDASLDRLLGVYFDILTTLKRSITEAQQTLTTYTSTITTISQSLYQLEERFSEMSADVQVVETLIQPWNEVKTRYVG